MSKIRAAAEMMRNLPGRGQDISKQVLGNPGRRQEMMGRNIPGRGAPGGLAGSLRPVPGDISKAQALGLTTAMGGLGGLGVADLTEGFTETANIKNSIFSNPEELGRQAAKAKMTLQEIMDRARGKAEELGEAPQIYMLKIQSGYQDEMNNQQMQEPQRIYDEDQGMKPVSLFMAGGGSVGGISPEDNQMIQRAFSTQSGFDVGQTAQMLKDILVKKYPNIPEPQINAILSKGIEDYSSRPPVPNMAEGGEADMQMSEQQAMSELEGIAPEAKMIEQLVMAVMQMIQQGVSEADVRAFLTEQGLDDEDIEDLFMIVMQQIEQGPTEEPIGQELQGMM
jgi:hypothetical protein